LPACGDSTKAIAPTFEYPRRFPASRRWLPILGSMERSLVFSLRCCRNGDLVQGRRAVCAPRHNPTASNRSLLIPQFEFPLRRAQPFPIVFDNGYPQTLHVRRQDFAHSALFTLCSLCHPHTVPATVLSINANSPRPSEHSD
jgi:hypothetical protein